jgi:hypothetical protein
LLASKLGEGGRDYRSFVAATTMPATTKTTMAICSHIQVGDMRQV